MSNNNLNDLGSVLENNLLSWIGAIGIFLLGGIAIYNFTRFGKTFSILTLLIALILIVVLVVDYFKQRNRYNGEPRPAIDFLAMATFAAGILVAWIIYEIWISDPSTGFRLPLSFIAGEVGIIGEKIAEEIVKNPSLVDKIKEQNNNK